MEKTGDYTEWARTKLVVSFPKPLHLVFFDNTERGVRCTEDIEENSALLCLPFTALMTKHHCTGTPFAEFAASLREDDVLALLLLFEKNERKEASKFHPHIEMLPTEYYSIVNYSAEELEQLRGCNLHVTGAVWQTQIESDYEALVSNLTFLSSDEATERGSLLQRFPWFTLDAYRWALCTVWSRFVTINRGSEVLRTMVPFFDFLNHRPGSRVSHSFDSARDTLTLLSMEHIPAGDEITLNYGNKSNEELLKLYGFVIPPTFRRRQDSTEDVSYPDMYLHGTDYIMRDGNIYNSVCVYAGLDPRTPLYSAKQTVMRALRLPTAGETPFEVTYGKLPEALLSFVRIQHAQSVVQVNKLAACGGGSLVQENGKRGYAEEDGALELAVAEAVQTALSGMLAGYPWDMKEDETRLLEWLRDCSSSHPLPPHGGVTAAAEGTIGGVTSSAAALPPAETLKNAVILRHMEMRILSNVVGLLEEYRNKLL